MFSIMILFTFLGTLLGTVFSLIPSLHIYNVAGFALLLWTLIQNSIPPEAIAPFFISLVVAFAFINTIPMTFIGAPDESATVTILPGTTYMMQGKGYEAAMLSGIGSLIGVALLIILTPFFFYIFPYINAICSLNMHWILGLVMVYMLMSEWPKGAGQGKTIYEKFTGAWGNLFAGLTTFGLSAFLGLIILNKSIISPEIGFQNIMPVFVGLFAIPSIIQNLLSNTKIPPQHIAKTVDLDSKTMGKSAFQGGISGLLAAYLPGVTAGIGGIIAGHATALRGDRLFIMGGGVAKVIYYVGAFLFLFIITPLSPYGMGKGGLNIILKPIFSPGPKEYGIVLSSIVLSGCISFLLLMYLSKKILNLLKWADYHTIYWMSFILIVAIVTGLTGFVGLFIMMIATCIGSIPVFYHSRRSNCMAVLIFPICINMAGYAPTVMRILGLE